MGPQSFSLAAQAAHASAGHWGHGSAGFKTGTSVEARATRPRVTNA